jgi:hypothetical protein
VSRTLPNTVLRPNPESGISNATTDPRRASMFTRIVKNAKLVQNLTAKMALL